MSQPRLVSAIMSSQLPIAAALLHSAFADTGSRGEDVLRPDPSPTVAESLDLGVRAAMVFKQTGRGFNGSATGGLPSPDGLHFLFQRLRRRVGPTDRRIAYSPARAEVGTARS